MSNGKNAMPMTLFRRGLLAAGTAALCTPHIARAAVRTLKLGQGSGPGSPPGVACHTMADAAARHPALQSTLRIDVRDNGSLGDDNSMLHGCMDGTLDLAVVGTTVASAVCPEIGLMDAPFLFKSSSNARAALDGPIGQEFADLLKAKGINVIGWPENGLRHITANRSVRSPSDLAGLKLRVPPSEVMRASFKSLGADVRTVPFPQIYEALRTGEVEAEENPIGLIESSKLYEVQKFLCLTAHIYSCSLLVASPDMLEDLSADEVKALRECAQTGTTAARTAADAAQNDGAARLRARGMTVVSDIDSPAFMAANRPNLDTLGAKIGPALMGRLVRAGAEA
jgi:tripartite ATP-independent transporter DctP family solute receptor